MPLAETLRLQRRKLATAEVVLRFWNVQPYRFVWHRVLRHRFAPQAVWLRYWSLHTKRLHDAAFRACQYHGH